MPQVTYDGRTMLRKFLRDTLSSAANKLLGNETPAAPKPPATVAPRRAREPAPVMVYVEWDSPGRDEVVALLQKRQIPFRLLEIDRDEATRAFVKQTARRGPPVLFIATEVVGWYDELVALDASGELARRVFGP